jgi:hypothetical protein
MKTPIELAQDLEDFKKSKPVASSYQEEILEKCQTLTALQQQVYRSLLGTNFDDHHEALKIYKLLQSL